MKQKKVYIMDRQKMRFTREQRMAIVREYETSSLTGAELAVKYGFDFS